MGIHTIILPGELETRIQQLAKRKKRSEDVIIKDLIRISTNRIWRNKEW